MKKIARYFFGLLFFVGVNSAKAQTPTDFIFEGKLGPLDSITVILDGRMIAGDKDNNYKPSCAAHVTYKVDSLLVGEGALVSSSDDSYNFTLTKDLITPNILQIYLKACSDVDLALGAPPGAKCLQFSKDSRQENQFIAYGDANNVFLAHDEPMAPESCHE